MANFNRDNSGGYRGGFGGGRRSFGGRGGFGGGRGGDRGDRGDRQMFSAICSNCGKECLVPFKPTGDKPVYCDDCFAKMRGGNSRQEGRGSQGGNTGGGEQYRAQLDAIHAKLDKILNMMQPGAAAKKPAKPVEIPAGKTVEVPAEVVAQVKEVKSASAESNGEVKEEKKAKKATKEKKAAKKKETKEVEPQTDQPSEPTTPIE